jgi:hypothetical protein
MGRFSRIVSGIMNVFYNEFRRRNKIVDDFNGYKELVEYRDNNDGTLTVVKTYDVETNDGVTFRVTGSNDVTYPSGD